MLLQNTHFALLCFEHFISGIAPFLVFIMSICYNTFIKIWRCISKRSAALQTALQNGQLCILIFPAANSIMKTEPKPPKGVFFYGTESFDHW
jgi:hypothetical protein